MELEIRDYDEFIMNKLSDITGIEKLIIYAILMECFKCEGTNKYNLINHIKLYSSDIKIDELINSSITYKEPLKKFKALDNTMRNIFLYKIIEIIEKCEEKDGSLVIGKRTILNSEKKVNSNEVNNKIELQDSDLEKIIIDIESGKILCKKMKYNHETSYKNFPVSYSIDEIEIQYINEVDLKNNFDDYKLIYINDMKKVFQNNKVIEEKIIEKIYDWYTEGDSQMNMTETYTKLSISVTIWLNNEVSDTITMNSSWAFEEEYSDEMSGYAEIVFNTSDFSEIKYTDIGFF